MLIAVFGYKYVQTFGIEQITTKQLAVMLEERERGDIVFVDVREAHEYTEGHIKGMINVPLSEIEESYHLIPAEQTVVVFCRSGNRSLQAVNKLKDFGYESLINVKGGMLAWEGEVIQ